ncbi:lytic transglycosylase domain-containing protein [Methylobacterium sp. A54F]
MRWQAAPSLGAAAWGGWPIVRALALCAVAVSGLILTLPPFDPAKVENPDRRPSFAVRLAVQPAVRAGPRPAPSLGGDLLIVRPAEGADDARWILSFGERTDEIRGLILASAARNALPADFFLRLLHQESRLDPKAVSRAGAQGIAQFMPYTAAERGLRDPFDPREAIPKSAELLREHQARFGNLGLAAAAYNAGPRRVQDWLDGRSGLPAETRTYVLRITGRPVEAWAPGGVSPALPILALTSLGTGLAQNATAGLLSPGAPVFETRAAPRRLTATEARRGARASSREARADSPRSEQGLCSALNRSGATCLVQAVY